MDVAIIQSERAFPVCRAKRPPAPVDRRTRQGRRAKELRATFTAQVGPTAAERPAVALAIDKAADLQTLAEDLRARALRGGDDATVADLTNQLIRVERQVTAALRDLNVTAKKTETDTDKLFEDF